MSTSGAWAPTASREAKVVTLTLAPGCKHRLLPSPGVPSRHRRANGFTLIELMVVMVIVGIAASLAAVNLGVLDRQSANDELQRLQYVLQFASERAAVRGTPIQVEFLPGSYRFSKLDTGGKWQLLFQPRELAEREWIDGLRVMALTVDERTLPQSALRIVFASEATPFTLQLSTNEGTRLLIGNSAGEVSQSAPGVTP
ncbi:GspH/FimT family pseudopilin [Viridibacterium curvum]